jgi:hypothetical protein
VTYEDVFNYGFPAKRINNLSMYNMEQTVLAPVYICTNVEETIYLGPAGVSPNGVSILDVDRMLQEGDLIIREVCGRNQSVGHIARLEGFRADIVIYSRPQPITFVPPDYTPEPELTPEQTPESTATH